MPVATRRSASPKRAAAPSSAPARAGNGATKKKPRAAPISKLARLVVGAAAFVLLVLANLGQHRWHPPLTLVEVQATATLGGADWRSRFDPYASTNGEFIWTPAHEARLQDFSGKGVYLTACTIFLQAAYQGCSLLVELLGESAAPRGTQIVYHCTPFFNGFGILVCCMFLFFWLIQVTIHPEWRAQWNFFEARGYAYMPLMCLVHLPSLACGFLDVLSKKPALLAHHCPSRTHLLLAVTAYHATFECWLLLNWTQTGGAIPYPWYYDIARSPYPLGALLLYLVVVNVMVSYLVLGYRRFILSWVGWCTA